jgi:hypothetical protein
MAKYIKLIPQLLNQCTDTAEVQMLLSEKTGTSKYFRYTESIK